MALSSFVLRALPWPALLLAAGAAWAQPALTRDDAGFLQRAARGGLAQVQAARMAQAKATHAQVKSYALQAAELHGKAGDELRALAARKGAKLPTNPSVKQQTQLKLMAAAAGAGFDQHYAHGAGAGAHADLLRLYQKAARQATDADVKAFATRYLPVLQQQLEQARDLDDTTTRELHAQRKRPPG